MKYSGDVKQEMENGYELLVTSNDDVKVNWSICRSRDGIRFKPYEDKKINSVCVCILVPFWRRKIAREATGFKFLLHITSWFVSVVFGGWWCKEEGLFHTQKDDPRLCQDLGGPQCKEKMCVLRERDEKINGSIIFKVPYFWLHPLRNLI